MIAIGSKNFERRHHSALETHHPAHIGDFGVPADGKVPTLPTIGWLGPTFEWVRVVHETPI